MSIEFNFNLNKKQSIAFNSEANEILYGGAAGGGKSWFARFISIYYCQSINNLNIYIFRRQRTDLVKNHLEGPSGYSAMLAPMIKEGLASINHSTHTIHFKNTDSKIFLCHCQHESDVYNYQGPEIHVLIIDEATHFTEGMYRYLRSRVRFTNLNIPKHMSCHIPKILLFSNPGNVGHNYFKAEFIDPKPPYEIWNTEGGFKRQYIPALVTDNTVLMKEDPEYINRLKTVGSPHLVKALLEGDWNIVIGGALDDVWSDDIILPRFKIPNGWYIDRTFDWGSSHPFAVVWFAEANGETIILPSGERFTPEPGSVIVIQEWYGEKGAGTNEGLKLSAREIAIGIKDIEHSMMANGYIASKPEGGPADNQIYDVREPDRPSIGTQMEELGIEWEESNKSPGSRVNGLQILRDYMKSTNDGEGAGFYVMEHCRSIIATLPTLERSKRNPEDVDTNGHDHLYDCIRYRLLRKQSYTSIPYYAGFN